MAVIAQYGLAGDDTGILAVVFPGVRVLRGPQFPEFVLEKRLIVVSDKKPFPYYLEKEIIQISTGADWQLDTRRGFLRYLAQSGVKATNSQVEALLEMEDEHFWPEAKCALLLGRFPNVPKKQIAGESGRVYQLYSVMFEEFSAAYVEYHRLRTRMPWHAVFSALLTMALKARNVGRRGDLSPFYRKLLLKNRKFDGVFRQALERLMLNKRNRWRPEDEKHFLTFLLECATNGKRLNRASRDPLQIAIMP